MSHDYEWYELLSCKEKLTCPDRQTESIVEELRSQKSIQENTLAQRIEISI